MPGINLEKAIPLKPCASLLVCFAAFVIIFPPPNTKALNLAIVFLTNAIADLNPTVNNPLIPIFNTIAPIFLIPNNIFPNPVLNNKSVPPKKSKLDRKSILNFLIASALP